MRVAQFLENFRYVAEAPNGVARLRELVLQLAVSGGLVEQDPSEGSGSNAIMVAEQGRLDYQSGLGLRNRKLRGQIRDDEKFFVIPDSWQWARMERIACYIQRGKGPSYAIQGQVRVVSQKCVQWSGFDLSPARYVSDESLERYAGERFLAAGDILWNSTGTGTAGRVAVFPAADALAVADSHVTVIRLTNFFPRFVWCYLASPSIQQRVLPGLDSSLVSGTTNQVELSTTKVMELPVPCPPIAEQQRIVAKVGELMALCDKLEAQQQASRRLFPLLSDATNSELSEVADETALDAVFRRAGEVDPFALRRSILRLAAFGKLTRQDPRAESAPELLRRIATARDRLLGEDYPNATEATTQRKKQRQQRLPAELSALPVGWTWATLMQATALVVDCHNKTAPYTTSGIRLIRTTNIRNGEMNFLEPKFVAQATYERWSARCPPEPGDLLITREAPMGEVCIIPDGVKICMGQRMMLIRIVAETMNRKFLLYSLMEPGLLDRVQDKPIGATVKHLRVGGVETLLLPVAPLEEQNRIVALVEQLFAVVDRLAAKQVERASVAESFAQAAVAAITGTASQESKPMQAPPTELVTRLEMNRGKNRGPGAAEPLAALLAEQDGPLSAKALWQRSGLAIDAFYQQLKTEMVAGWILEPEPARMREVEAD